MTQIYITIGIISVVALLVCYIFVKQTLSERNNERDRLNRALSKRAKDLLQTLSVFPEGFLPQEIRIFVYRCIIDAYQQLSKLEPSETQYEEALKIHSAQLENILRAPVNKAAINLQSSTQINEIRQYLNLLGRFLQKSLQRKQISSKQFSHYKMLLRGLNAKLAVDSYMLTAKQASDIQKYKLAIHYYDLAKKLLAKETPENYQDQIARINAAMEPLLELEGLEQSQEEQAIPDDGSDATSPSKEADNAEEDEWNQFQDDSGWKKKNIYD